MTAEGWTISEALEQFAAAGMPVDEARFRVAVTRVARIPRVGETPSGEKGGRGKLLYDVGQLHRLHAALVPWLTPQALPGRTGTAVPAGGVSSGKGVPAPGALGDGVPAGDDDGVPAR